MEKLSISRSDSPVKTSRRGEYKVQFADASEYCKTRGSNAGKPPEVPRPTSTGQRTNPRPSSCSTGSLNSCSSNSIGSKLNKGGSTSSSVSGKQESYGSTTSLDRRRQGSTKSRPPERTLQPISDAKRSQSLDRRRLERSLYESNSSLLSGSDRKKRERNEANGSDRRVRSPYASTTSSGKQSMRSCSGERSKSSNRPKTSHPNLNSVDQSSYINSTSNVTSCSQANHSSKPQTLGEFNGASDRSHNNDDWMERIKRAASRSPHRKSSKASCSSKDEEKENEKSKDHWSRRSDRRHDRERGRSLRREASSGRLPPEHWTNNNLEDVWSFEPGVMWSRTLHNRRIGYLLFSCSNLDTPRNNSFPVKFNMTYKFSPQADSKLIRLVLEAHGFTEVSSASSSFNMYWSNTHFNPNEIRMLQDWQKVNHFPRSSELTRKDRLYLNIKRMQRQFGVKLFDFIPTSFVLPTEHREFCETHLRERGTWIVKPVASSQGKGIYLVSQIDQVPVDETSLISRYIEAPLLVNGYKCDLRLYVAVTSLDPLLVYMFEEGLVRLATVKYQHKKNLWNPCIHLTNYSVNKFHSNYVHNQDPDVDNEGSKWSLSAFLRHLRLQGVDTAAVMRSVEDVIIKSLFAAAYQMNTATSMFVPHARNCFELYGFDILIDEQLKPWVLEVNLSPSLNIDQPLDLKIKSSMLADLFSLAGLLICNPSTAKVTSKPSLYRKLPNLRHSTESYERQALTRSPAAAVSMEELRLVRQVVEENQRRGGWARIFPTPDSWSVYGGLQEYDSPLNLMLHTHLYPNVQRSTRLRVARCSSMSTSSGLASSLERLTCYERPLPKGLAFIKHKLGIGKAREERRNPREAHEVKQSLLEALENGLKLSKYQARMAFGVYLQHVQRRLMIGCDEENQTDLVYRFLRSASRTLHLPISVQSPSKNLPEEARAVVISKQLGDFIMAYTRETQIHYDPPAPVQMQVQSPTDQEKLPISSAFQSDTTDTTSTAAATTSSLPTNTDPQSSKTVSSVTSIALPSSFEEGYKSYSSFTVVAEGACDKSVRFSPSISSSAAESRVSPTRESRMICRYPSTSSFNDFTPSDVADPLDPLLSRSVSDQNSLLRRPSSSSADDFSHSLQPLSMTSETSSTYSGVTLTPPTVHVALDVNATFASPCSLARADVVVSACNSRSHEAVPPIDTSTTQLGLPDRALQDDLRINTSSTCNSLGNAESSSVHDNTKEFTAISATSGGAFIQSSDDGSSIASCRNLSATSLTTSDLAGSLMSASNDSFSSLSTSGLSGSYLSASVYSSSSLTNSFSSASIPLTESSSSTSVTEDLSVNTFITIASSANCTVNDTFMNTQAPGHDSAYDDIINLNRNFDKTGPKLPSRHKSSGLPGVHSSSGVHRSASLTSPTSIHPTQGPILVDPQICSEELPPHSTDPSIPPGEMPIRNSYPLLSSPSLVASVLPLARASSSRTGSARRLAVARSTSFPSSSASLPSPTRTFQCSTKSKATRTGSLCSPSSSTAKTILSSVPAAVNTSKKHSAGTLANRTFASTTSFSDPCFTISLPCVPPARPSASSFVNHISTTTVIPVSGAEKTHLSSNLCYSNEAVAQASATLPPPTAAPTADSTVSTSLFFSTSSSTSTFSESECGTTTTSKMPIRKMKSLDADFALRSDGESGIAMSSSGSSWRPSEGEGDEGGEDGPHATCVTGPADGDTVAMELYRAFMSAARETDLEEVLALQTKLHNSAGMFLDSARRSVTAPRHHTSSTTTAATTSRPRTPTASPHGSPRRGRKSPSMHGSHSRLVESTAPVTSEPQGSTVRAPPAAVDGAADRATPPVKGADATVVAGGATTAAKAGGPSSQNTCCFFGNILKASLKGTNTTFSV